MPYNNFAYYYDLLNQSADYDALAGKILEELQNHNIHQGILADLGCGTGELSLRLSDAGYNMIAVDRSCDMLSVFRNKLEEKNILLLEQDLAQLDLYGTVRAAVSTFDTLNHLPGTQLQDALQRIALFLEPDGIFIFDVNSPYKHEHILANKVFEIAAGDITCVWKNRLSKNESSTSIEVAVYQASKLLFQESFFEYYYSLSFWKEILARCGLLLDAVYDGEKFSPVQETSQRYLLLAKKVRE